MALRFKNIDILVIEDNFGDFVLIEEYLGSEIPEAKIQQAKTLGEAKKITDHQQFDVILLDLTLPDSSGEELISETLKLSGDTPIIVLTGYSNKDFGIKTLGLGMADYLLKDDLTPSQLVKSITYSIERKKINSELKNSEEKYRNLFQLSPTPMWVYDVDTLRFLDVNLAACKHYLYTKSEFLSLTLEDIHPARDLDKVRETAANNKTFGTYFEGVFDQVKKNGEEIKVQVQSDNIEFSEKNARLVIATDVTEKLKAQAEREKLITELIRTNKDLKQFSYITSHNLRGPIAQLLGLTNLIDMYPVADETLSKILLGVKAAATNFDETVKDLSRILEVKESALIVKEEIELESCFNRVLAEHDVLVRNRPVAIAVNFEEAPVIYFNMAYLENIFSHLLSNAFKYSCKSSTLHISIKSKHTDKKTLLIFQDNGLGMDLNLYRDKLFGLYQRFHQNTEGKGVGLFLVKTQMEALNGAIHVDSEPNKGTVFTLSFEKPTSYLKVG